jgi:hypothetical protein
MVHVLLGYVRIVPEHFLLELPGRCVMLQPANFRANDPFQSLNDGARANAVQRIRPRRPLAQAHRIVVSVSETESNRDPSGRLEAQRIDQLLTKEAHRRRAEDNDPLLVQADDPLVRPKVEQFCEMQILAV